jgi:hypothetical protein
MSDNPINEEGADLYIQLGASSAALCPQTDRSLVTKVHTRAVVQWRCGINDADGRLPALVPSI